MGYAQLHPNWERTPVGITEGFSLEMTARDIGALHEAAPMIPAQTPIAIPWLPGEALAARVAAAVAVRALGCEPMPHFSARRIVDAGEFEAYLAAVVEQAGVRRCFVVAGDPPEPQGPFFDSAALIATGAFERAGIAAIGIGGHPDGHPQMSEAQCWAAIENKVAAITARGMAPLIVTQFAFDAGAVLSWLAELRKRGLTAPVRLGIPGPAGIKTLMRFAARCGVGASASVLTKYGISITKLIGTAGPDKLVDQIEKGLTEEHGAVRLHFYPFGGLTKTVAWINDYAKSH